ncbi:MAG: RsmD family RNA methyltransferase, partial [Pirellulales bacterium]
MPRKRKTTKTSHPRRRPEAEARGTEVRIIGGEFRGRRLRYHGDPGVRPMKHRTREAIFNLVSTECTGRHAIDLFAGTGALGLEALSRGAASATLIEKHVPTARVVAENISTLGVEDRATLLVTSAFLWAKRDLANVGRTILSV